MKRKNTVRTEDEIRRDKEIILQSSREGISMREMARMLGVPTSYIEKHREELIAEGRITETEIKEAFSKHRYEVYKKNRRLDEQKKDDPRRKLSRERREKVYELATQNYAITEIARELGISTTTVSGFLKTFIAEGRLEEIAIRRLSNSEKSHIDKNSPEYIKKRDEVEKLLRRGYKNDAIRNTLGLLPLEMTMFYNDITDHRIFTRLEVKRAREHKHELDLQFIEDSVKNGCSVSEIIEENPEYTYNRVTPMLKELIAKGRISREQIDENGKKARNKKLNKDSQMSIKEQEQFVMAKVKEGYLPSEILESDETGSLTINKVLYYKRKAIIDGIISQEEADRAMAERREIIKGKNHENAIEIVKSLIEQGYSIAEISDETDYSYSYLLQIVEEYKKEHGWYSKEELKEFKKKRQERENPSKTPKKRKSSKRHIEITGRFLAYVKEGYTYEEIAKMIGCSTGLLVTIKKECIERNEWFSEESLKEFEERRKRRILESGPEKMAEHLRKEEEEKRRNREKELKKKRARKKEIDAKWEKTQKEAKTQKTHIEELKAMIRYTMQGYTIEEIAKLMGCSKAHIDDLRHEYKSKRYWFSPESLREFKNKRKIREAKERKIAEEKALAEKEKREAEERYAAQRLKIEIKTMVNCVMQGYNISEIATLMSCNIAHVRELIEEYKKEKPWFSQKSLRAFREQRVMRESGKDGTLVSTSSRDDTGKPEEQKSRTDVKKIKKHETLKKFSKLNAKIREMRKLAKREDKQEYNGEENVPTTAREQFMQLLVEMSQTGITFPESDMNLVMDTLYMYPKLANAGNIKFLITNASKLGGAEAAHKMIIELMRSLKDTRFHEPLVNYRVWMKKKILLPRMQEMKSQGMDSTAIGEKLGISSTEVLMLLDGDEVDFFGD